MDWSPQQDRALVDIEHWLNDPSAPQVYRLFGYAGTGKSTLAKAINELVDNRAKACAYTGKAASVMARKGLYGASTVHRLIYTPVGNDGSHVKELEAELKLLEEVTTPSKGLTMRTEAVRIALQQAKALGKQPQFLLKEESAVSDAPLVILDECSMVPERMALDLLSFGVKVLVLGDPAQLPPVKGTGWFIDAQPDTLLTEVHRQAKDNPIINLATMVREGKNLPYGDFGLAQVVRKIDAEKATSADQILCGTNAKRYVINRRHRVLGGYSAFEMPCAGEKVVCLRNNHDLGLLNGTIWDVDDDSNEHWEPGESAVHLKITPDTGGLSQTIAAEAVIFIDEEQKPQWSSFDQFTWGYCLTVHKSQGSQWDDVVLFDDWPAVTSHRNWLYTGITRAAETLTVVKS